MSAAFHATLIGERDGIATVRLSFGDPATNAEIVPAALDAIRALNLTGGRGIHFTGPASLPAAMALAHAVSHLYGYVACHDPKLEAFVVAISHDPAFRPGQLIPAGNPSIQH